ncbi:MAG: YybH family protein [Pseudobdellovibrionaceae bacterium]
MEPQVRNAETTKYTDLSSEAEIRQLMEDVSEAVRTRDVHTILEAYASDVTIFDVRDKLKMNKDGLKISWQECFDSSTEFSYKIKDLKINIDDNLAHSFCLSHCTGLDIKGNKIDIWIRVTTCYAKRDNKWIVVHEHSSVPGDFMSGKILQNLKPEHSQRI